MPNKYVEARESLYLLSIELIVLYTVAFGLLSLKTDNMFSVGMAYPAILCTFLVAFLLTALGLLCGMLGIEGGSRATLAGARGAAVFVCVAFLLNRLELSPLQALAQMEAGRKTRCRH
jgi:hypothetical protein